MYSMLFKGLFFFEMCSFYSNMAARGTFLKFLLCFASAKGGQLEKTEPVFHGFFNSVH